MLPMTSLVFTEVTLVFSVITLWLGQSGNVVNSTAENKYGELENYEKINLLLISAGFIKLMGG